MKTRVERHKRGWAAVEITTAYGYTFKRVVEVYTKKADAENHWKDKDK